MESQSVLGIAGSGGVGPTLYRARTHDALPLDAAAPLVAHMVNAYRAEGVEAAAALFGLSAWVAKHTAADLDGTYGHAAADAAMMMALDGDRLLDFPDGMRMRTTARPVWEALAVEYAASRAAEEAALYRSAGADDVGIAYVADISPEALRLSGGAMALFAWPTTSGA